MRRLHEAHIELMQGRLAPLLGLLRAQIRPT